MKVDKKNIRKELRGMGKIMQIFQAIFFTKRGFPILSKFSSKKRRRVKASEYRLEEIWIDRKDGSKLRLCVYSPTTKYENVPGLLWMHGGGYILGSPEQSAFMAKSFMKAHPCVVVAPGYRRSLEAPYPAALQDCYDALCWMKNQREQLGIRLDQLMIGGDSAGGGLAAALSLYARDLGEVSIAYQMPLYPMLDDRMATESSKFANTPVWDARSNRQCWEYYLGALFGKDEVPCYAAAGRAVNFEGLPPTTTFVGELEPFRDETIQYVENLRTAGIPVRFQVFEGCYHAFDQMCPKAEVSKEAMKFLLEAYIYAVENYVAVQPIKPIME